MSKRTIDLTNDEETPERADERVEEEEDGMQVDVAPPRRVLVARRNLVVHPAVRALPLPLVPEINTFQTNGPTQTHGSSAGLTTTTSRRGLPDHMHNTAMADEVVLTSILVLRAFDGFPPEVIELLCNWTCFIYEVKEKLAHSVRTGSFPMHYALMFDPTAPASFSRFKGDKFSSYLNWTTAMENFVPFRDMFSRICLNVMQMQRCEFALREMEHTWVVKTAGMLKANFPGQRAFITPSPVAICGATSRLAIPRVQFSLADTYGNLVSTFTFNGFQFGPEVKMAHLVIASDDPPRDFGGKPIFTPYNGDYDLYAAMTGNPPIGEEGFQGLVPACGMSMVRGDPNNSRLTFFLRDSYGDSSDDDSSDDNKMMSFKFVVENDE